MKPSLILEIKKNIHPDFPFTLIDIGVMGGIAKKWDSFKEHIRIIGFEPDPREFQKLVVRKQDIFSNYALYSSSKKLTYHILKTHGRSSILKPNKALFTDYEKPEGTIIDREVIIPKEKVITLDTFLVKNPSLDIDFIKIDTEGTELEILHGAKLTFSNTYGFQIEVSFAQLRIGQSFFRDVDKFMNENGFDLIDLKRNFWKKSNRNILGNYKGKGQLIFGDALYFKKSNSLFQELEGRDKNYCISKIYKAIMIALTYRLFDIALDILQKAQTLNYIDNSQFSRLLLKIKDEAKQQTIPKFPGRFFLYRCFRKLSKLKTAISYYFIIFQ
jgi:FkbM family methyltransferase